MFSLILEWLAMDINYQFNLTTKNAQKKHINGKKKSAHAFKNMGATYMIEFIIV